MSKLTESFFENTLTPTSFCHHPLRYAFKLREPQTPVNSAYNRLTANFPGVLTGRVTCFALVGSSSLELIPYRSEDSNPVAKNNHETFARDLASPRRSYPTLERPAMVDARHMPNRLAVGQH